MAVANSYAIALPALFAKANIGYTFGFPFIMTCTSILGYSISKESEYQYGEEARILEDVFLKRGLRKPSSALDMLKSFFYLKPTE